MRVLCIGSATQDVFLSNSDEFAPVCENPTECFLEIPLGSKVNINKIVFTSGGGASNAAITFARAGEKTLFLGAVGRDPAGILAIQDMINEKINVRHVAYSEKYSTDYSTLLLAPNGERTILTYRGSGVHLQKPDFDLDRIREKIDWIYITSLAAHFPIYHDIFKKAKKRNIKIAFNPGAWELDQPEKLREILPFVTILSVNKEEAKKIVSGETLSELAKNLQEFCPVVLVTDGRNGSVARGENSAVQAGLYDEKMPVDATGAGDSFASAFTLAFARGENLANCVRWAAANSSSVVQKIGAKTGIRRSYERLKKMDIREIY